jgi:hypothetical protein
MPNITYENLIDPHPTARGAAANTFTTFRDVSPVPLPALIANELKVGSKVELEAFGEFSTTVTPTLQIGFIYGATAGAAGGVTLAASGAITTASGAAQFPWHAKWVGTVTAVGTAGVIYGSGILDLGTSLIAFASSAMPVTAAARSVAIDTTTAKLIGVGAAWGTSSVSNSITVDLFTCKIINQGKT